MEEEIQDLEAAVDKKVSEIAKANNPLIKVRVCFPMTPIFFYQRLPYVSAASKTRSRSSEPTSKPNAVRSKLSLPNRRKTKVKGWKEMGWRTMMRICLRMMMRKGRRMVKLRPAVLVQGRTRIVQEHRRGTLQRPELRLLRPRLRWLYSFNRVERWRVPRIRLGYAELRCKAWCETSIYG